MSAPTISTVLEARKMLPRTAAGTMWLMFHLFFEWEVYFYLRLWIVLMTFKNQSTFFIKHFTRTELFQSCSVLIYCTHKECRKLICINIPAKNVSMMEQSPPMKALWIEAIIKRHNQRMCNRLILLMCHHMYTQAESFLYRTTSFMYFPHCVSFSLCVSRCV